MTEITKEQVVEYIVNMSLLEASDLVKTLEQTLGVSAAAPVMAAGPAVAVAEKAVEAEKTEFNVILTGFGDKKIQVIKVVRALTGLGLKEAKDLVDGVPKPVKEGVSKEDAQDAKAKLEEAGATVEVK